MEIQEELLDKAKELVGDKLGIDSGMLNSVSSMLGIGGQKEEAKEESDDAEQGDADTSDDNEEEESEGNSEDDASE